MKANGEVEYLIYNLEAAWAGSINMLRLSFEDMAADAVLYVEEIRLFASMEDAYNYAGEEILTRPPVVVDPGEDKTETPSTEAKTEEVTTDSEKTEGGCKSVVAASVVAVVAAAAAFVALKKKD